jgi:hemolysin III
MDYRPAHMRAAVPPLELEEIANSLTHALGLVFSLAAAPLLVAAATARGDSLAVVSCSVFALSLVLLYGASTAYHMARRPIHKSIMQVLDHSCIYLLIAGSYTPFALITLRGAWGWSMFGVVWGMAVIGILFKIFFTGRFHTLSNFFYLGMGWFAVIGWKPMQASLPAGGMTWLMIGGAAYTLGIVFFILDEKIKFFHAIWHLFVLAGSAAHVVAVYQYVLAPPIGS